VLDLPEVDTVLSWAQGTKPSPRMVSGSIYLCSYLCYLFGDIGSVNLGNFSKHPVLLKNFNFKACCYSMRGVLEFTISSKNLNIACTISG